MNYDKEIAPEDQADHEIGLEMIRVLKLRRKRDNGRIETTHGDKTPCGLARTVRSLDEEAEAARVGMLAALKEAEKMLSGIFREIELPGEWETGVSETIDTAREAIARTLRALDKDAEAARAGMLAALREAAEFMTLARQHFPKSLRNSDKFKLETTCAAIGSAIHNATSTL